MEHYLCDLKISSDKAFHDGGYQCSTCSLHASDKYGHPSNVSQIILGDNEISPIMYLSVLFHAPFSTKGMLASIVWAYPLPLLGTFLLISLQLTITSKSLGILLTYYSR